MNALSPLSSPQFFVGARDDGIALNGLIYLDRYICLPRFVDILMDRRLILFYIRRARYYFGVVILYVFHVFFTVDSVSVT